MRLLNIKYIIILLCLLSSSLITSQNKKITTEQSLITPEFEKFDTLKFEKFKINRFDAWEYLDDRYNTAICLSKVKAGCSYSKIIDSSYFYLRKVFYPSGNIKSKGLAFIYEGFEKGIWYYFDEKGNPTDSMNQDKFFKFTFEDVLKFAEKEGLIFMKTPIDKESYSPYVPNLKRYFDKKINKGFWEITWFNRKMGKIEVIQLDAETGKVLDREYGEFII